MTGVPLRRAAVIRQPKQWRPWAALPWLLSLVVAMGTAPIRYCDDTSSCQDTWWEGIPTLVFFVSVVVVAMLPRWARAATAIATGVLAVACALDPGALDKPRTAAAVLLGLLVVNLAGEIDTRRAAFPQGPIELGDWDAPSLPVRGGVQRGWGLAVVAVASLIVGVSAFVGIEQHDREAHAQVRPGVVTRVPGEDFVLVTVNGSIHKVDVPDSSDYESGDVAEVFVDADGPFRMRSEPFNVMAGVYSGLVLLSAGLALVLRGVLRRRADLEASTGLRPRVLARVAPSGQGLLLYEPDDVDGARGPVAEARSVSRWPAPPEPSLVSSAQSWITRPAYVYGEVRHGGLVSVRTSDEVFCTQAPLRLT